MSEINYYECDRCKSLHIDRTGIRVITGCIESKEYDSKYDLCVSCIIKLREFLEGGLLNNEE